MHWLQCRVVSILREVARYRATLFLTGIVILVGCYTNGNSQAQHQRLLERFGSDVDGFGIRRLLTIPFATFIQSSPGVEWHMILLVAAPLAIVERSLSSRRALVTFVLSDWISAPLTLVAIWVLALLGSNQATALLDVADAGSSAAAHGTLAVACLLLSGIWRICALTALYSYVISAFFFQRLDASLAHLLATLVGSLIGLYWLRHPEPKERNRNCSPEAAFSALGRQG